MSKQNYIVRNIKDVPPVPCLCGSSIRPITRKDTPVANLHVTHIMDSKKHYHKNCTEYYYILEGSGKMELDDDVVDLEPGVVICIPPMVAHRGYGDFRAVIVGVPAMEHTDEFLADA